MKIGLKLFLLVVIVGLGYMVVESIMERDTDAESRILPYGQGTMKIEKINVSPKILNIFPFSDSSLVSPASFIQTDPNTLGWYQIKPTNKVVNAATTGDKKFISIL